MLGPMKYLHTMVRVSDLQASLDFYCGKLGLVELRRVEHPAGRFTLVFLAAPGDESAQIELTHGLQLEVSTPPITQGEGAQLPAHFWLLQMVPTSLTQ